MMIRIQVLADRVVAAGVRDPLRPLLDQAFPGFFGCRISVKQSPHVGIVMQDGDDVIGHVALDHRVIRIGDEVVRICGLIDLCVAAHRRGSGLGSRRLHEAELQARQAGGSSC